MGIFKERKRAKELETTYNEIVTFKKQMETATAENANIDVQSTYDKCEDLLAKIASAKAIVEEDLKKSGDVLVNAWFAAREALAYEYNIHKKRKEVLERDEKEIDALKTKMAELGAKGREDKSSETHSKEIPSQLGEE